MEKSFLEKLELLIREHTKPKYLDAKQVEAEFGIPAKTVLNRSQLPKRSKRHIPSYKLKGGRKRYFLRKDIERCFELADPTIYWSQKKLNCLVHV